MRPLVSSGLLLIALSLASCGSSDSTTASPTEGTGGAAGAGGGQSGGGGSAGSSAPSKAGFIGVTSQPTAMPNVFSNSVSASFYDGPGTGLPKGCTLEFSGACSVLLCDFTNGGAETPPTGAASSAGSIAIGGTTPAFSLSFDAAGMKYDVTPAIPTDKPLFVAGASIAFTASGADVPAFNATLVAPGALTVSAPAFTAGALSVDSTQDLGFVWTGSSAGQVSFTVVTVTSSGMTMVARSFVSCRFDANLGAGTMPKALLQKLPKTTATTTGLIGTDLSTTTSIATGDYMIYLAVGGVVWQPDGKTPYLSQQVTVL